MKKIINVILLFYIKYIFSRFIKMDIKIVGYVDLKTIKLPSGGQKLILH